MVQAVVRVQKNKNITLPNGILMKPGELIDPSQTYFWTKEWRTGEQEVENERRHGKTKRFRSMKALVRDLDR